jgi:hypothetical protein
MRIYIVFEGGRILMATERPQTPLPGGKTTGGSYVVMMDHHLDKFPDQWTYVHQDDTEEQAKLHSAYDRIVGQEPRDQFEQPTLIDGKKPYVYTPTGETSLGGVYRLTEK